MRFHPAAFQTLSEEKYRVLACVKQHGAFSEDTKTRHSSRYTKIRRSVEMVLHCEVPRCAESLPESCQSLQCAGPEVENDSVVTLELLNPSHPPALSSGRLVFSTLKYPFNHSVPLSSHFRY